jgi:hypothetical protein
MGRSGRLPDEPDFELDFLRTLGRGGDSPLFVPALNLSMQPLKFMEFSLEAPMKATLLYRNGPLVVNVTRPQRYVRDKWSAAMDGDGQVLLCIDQAAGPCWRGEPRSSKMERQHDFDGRLQLCGLSVCVRFVCFLASGTTLRPCSGLVAPGKLRRTRATASDIDCCRVEENSNLRFSGGGRRKVHSARL